jgi:hypothetical protein
MQGRQHVPNLVVLCCPEGGGNVGVNCKSEAGRLEPLARAPKGDA